MHHAIFDGWVNKLIIESIAGPTIATVPVRVRLDWDQTARALQRQVQQQALDINRHEQYGLSRIRRINDEASRFQLLLVVQPGGRDRSGLFGQAKSIVGTADDAGSDDVQLVAKDGDMDSVGMHNPYAMMVICQLQSAGLVLRVNYDPGAVETAAVGRMCVQLEQLIRQLCDEQLAESTLRSISPITKQDLGGQIWRWNRAVPKAAVGFVTSMIDEWATTNPDGLAVASWDRTLTYRQLRDLSEHLAYRLLHQGGGVGPGSLVVLNFDKSSWLVVCMMATLKMGATALPLSSPATTHRDLEIIEAVQPKLVLTSGAAEESPFYTKVPTMSVSDLTPNEEWLHVSEPHTVTPSDPALILFTSGSTGTPKSILWSHETLSSNVCAARDSFGITAQSRVLQFAGYEFDVSTVESLAVLSAGGTLCIPSEADRTNRLGVHEFLAGRLEATVVAEIFCPDKSDKETLALFVSPLSLPDDADNVTDHLKQSLPVDELEQALLESLPPHMIPKVYVPLAKMPTNRSGKTDRRRLVASARHQGLALTVADVFRSPLLEDMAECVRYDDESDSSGLQMIAPFSLLGAEVDEAAARRLAARACAVDGSRVMDVYPCTALQEGLLALGTREHGQYVSRSVLSLQPDIDPERLVVAWSATVANLPLLRTRIIDLPGQGLVQVVLDDLPLQPVDDLDAFLRRDQETPMGLGTELCRAAIVDRNFALTMHHCTYDGNTLKMILEELERQYLGRPGLSTTPFRNFIHHVGKMDKAKSAEFWKQQLSGSEAAQFPALPRATYKPQADQRLQHDIALTWPRAGVTPSTVARSAWALLAAQHTRCDDVLFAVTVSGRQAGMRGDRELRGADDMHDPRRGADRLGRDDRGLPRAAAERHGGGDGARAARPAKHLPRGGRRPRPPPRPDAAGRAARRRGQGAGPRRPAVPRPLLRLQPRHARRRPLQQLPAAGGVRAEARRHAAARELRRRGPGPAAGAAHGRPVRDGAAAAVRRGHGGWTGWARSRPPATRTSRCFGLRMLKSPWGPTCWCTTPSPSRRKRSLDRRPWTRGMDASRTGNWTSFPHRWPTPWLAWVLSRGPSLPYARKSQDGSRSSRSPFTRPAA